VGASGDRIACQLQLALGGHRHEASLRITADEEFTAGVGVDGSKAFAGGAQCIDNILGLLFQVQVRVVR